MCCGDLKRVNMSKPKLTQEQQDAFCKRFERLIELRRRRKLVSRCELAGGCVVLVLPPQHDPSVKASPLSMIPDLNALSGIAPGE